MSDCIIVVDRNNPDQNKLNDIAVAVAEIGKVGHVCEERHVIEAAIPTGDVPVVAAMTGVSYVRNVFSYYRTAADASPRKAA